MSFITVTDELSTQYEDDVTCPYCGYIQADSFNFPEEGEEKCAECGKAFDYPRNIEITYSTFRKEEEENER